MKGWFQRGRKRKDCFHHDHNTGETWIKSQLIEMGSSKMFWCTKCDKTWFV